jgi:hypothetical protein
MEIVAVGLAPANSDHKGSSIVDSNHKGCSFGFCVPSVVYFSMLNTYLPQATIIIYFMEEKH